jgi:hypothetical protein
MPSRAGMLLMHNHADLSGLNPVIFTNDGATTAGLAWAPVFGGLDFF